MKELSFKDFWAETALGRPNQAEMSIYEGLTFDCVCGSQHEFQEHTCRVIRELPRLVFVIWCPNKEGLNAVEVKGLFRRKMVTLFGTREAPDS